MAYLSRLIAFVLLSLAAVSGYAQSCTEYRVPNYPGDPDGHGGLIGKVVGTDWQMTLKKAYVGSTLTTTSTNPVHYALMETKITDYSASNGCKKAFKTVTHEGATTNHAPAWDVCTPFVTESRPVDQTPITRDLSVGYALTGAHEGEDAAQIASAYTGLVGQRVCMNNKRYFVEMADTMDVNTNDNCYTIGDKTYCQAFMPFKLTATCEVCQSGDPGADDAPTVPDSDGDGIPDDTDPEPNGPDTDGDGIPDSQDPTPNGPDTDGDGIPDSQDPTPNGDGDGGGGDAGGTGDGSGSGTGDGSGGGSSGDGGIGGTGGTGGTGSGVSDPFCVENPTAAVCQTGSFGGSCAGGFQCSGDAVQCAQAEAAWKFVCAVDVSGMTDQVNDGTAAMAAGAASGLGIPGGSDAFDLGSRLSEVPLFGSSGGCPSDVSVNVGGTSYTIAFSSMCPQLQVLGVALMAFAYLVAGFIVFRGDRS